MSDEEDGVRCSEDAVCSLKMFKKKSGVVLLEFSKVQRHLVRALEVHSDSLIKGFD